MEWNDIIIFRFRLMMCVMTRKWPLYVHVLGAGCSWAPHTIIKTSLFGSERSFARKRRPAYPLASARLLFLQSLTPIEAEKRSGVALELALANTKSVGDPDLSFPPSIVFSGRTAVYAIRRSLHLQLSIKRQDETGGDRKKERRRKSLAHCAVVTRYDTSWAGRQPAVNIKWWMVSR